MEQKEKYNFSFKDGKKFNEKTAIKKRKLSEVGEEVPEVDAGDELGVNTQYIQKQLLKYARKSKVSSAYAEELVDNILNMFYTLCEKKYDSASRMLFKKIFNLFMKKFS